MKKYILALPVIVALAFAVTACGSTATDEPVDKPAADTAAADTAKDTDKTTEVLDLLDEATTVYTRVGNRMDIGAADPERGCELMSDIRSDIGHLDAIMLALHKYDDDVSADQRRILRSLDGDQASINATADQLDELCSSIGL